MSMLKVRRFKNNIMVSYIMYKDSLYCYSFTWYFNFRLILWYKNVRNSYTAVLSIYFVVYYLCKSAKIFPYRRAISPSRSTHEERPYDPFLRFEPATWAEMIVSSGGAQKASVGENTGGYARWVFSALGDSTIRAACVRYKGKVTPTIVYFTAEQSTGMSSARISRTARWSLFVCRYCTNPVQRQH